MTFHFTAAASSFLAALLAISSPAAAQTQPAQPNASPPAAQQGAPEEPAASSEEAAEGESAEEAESSEEEEGYVPEDEAAVEEESAAEASPAPSAASLKSKVRLQDPNRSGRILTEVLIGLLGWTIGGYAGSGIGSNFAPRTSDYQMMYWATSFGWMVGSSLALPLAVELAGAMWKAQGEFLPTFLPALIGMGVQLGIGVALQLNNEMNYSFMPLIELVSGMAMVVGSAVGYELSHVKALRSAVPVARLLRFKDGGGVALAWAI